MEAIIDGGHVDCPLENVELRFDDDGSIGSCSSELPDDCILLIRFENIMVGQLQSICIRVNSGELYACDEPSCHLQMRVRSINIKPISHKSLPVGNIYLHVRDADVGNRMLFMIRNKDASVPVVPHPYVYDLMR